MSCWQNSMLYDVHICSWDPFYDGFSAFKKCKCCRAVTIWRIKLSLEQLLKRLTVRQTAIMNLSPMERCELLHSVGSVCSTHWSMRWTRRDWVIATNPANKWAKSIIAESQSISIDGNLPQACLKGISLAAVNFDFVMVGIRVGRFLNQGLQYVVVTRGTYYKTFCIIFDF